MIRFIDNFKYTKVPSTGRKSNGIILSPKVAHFAKSAQLEIEKDLVNRIKDDVRRRLSHLGYPITFKVIGNLHRVEAVLVDCPPGKEAEIDEALGKAA